MPPSNVFPASATIFRSERSSLVVLACLVGARGVEQGYTFAVF